MLCDLVSFESWRALSCDPCYHSWHLFKIRSIQGQGWAPTFLKTAHSGFYLAFLLSEDVLPINQTFPQVPSLKVNETHQSISLTYAPGQPPFSISYSVLRVSFVGRQWHWLLQPPWGWVLGSLRDSVPVSEPRATHSAAASPALWVVGAGKTGASTSEVSHGRDQ